MSKPAFFNQSSFSALTVESGEESEPEEVIDEPSATNSDDPPKLSKNAQRKAAQEARKAARAEEKKRLKAAKAQTNGSATPNVDLSRPGTPIASADEPPAVSAPPPPPPAASITKDDKKNPAVNGTSNGHTTAPAAAKPPPVPPGAELLTDLAPANPITATAEAVKEKVGAVSAAATNGVTTAKTFAMERADAAAEALSKVVEQDKQITIEETERQKKLQNGITRTVWTLIMIGGFITLLLMGHAYMVILVMICQTIVYREITALFSLKNAGAAPSKDAELKGRDPWSKTLNWYFFAVTNYFLYGESIIYYFKHVVFVDAHLTTLANKHRFISFMLYMIGFMGFVASLKRGYLKQQFGLFCWVHMTLMLIVVSSHFIVNNILEGLIWFWVPASLVICNDIFAYICGITFGRTPLIKLSPKKTVEGFVGAFFCTAVFSLAWGTYFARFPYMICPVQDLGVSAFDTVSCTPNPVFVWHHFELPGTVSGFLSTLFGRPITHFPYTQYEFHLLVMATFASLVAPFGGFFASGFKRAFNIKDFGDSIPGHGGMTDRMDCQFLMGIFTTVYYSSLIREHHVSVGSLLQAIVSGLTVEEQLQLIGDLKLYLESHGVAVSV